GDWIRKAFRPEWWQGPEIPAGLPNAGYLQIEGNFPLFWGLAVAAYQATLISDDAVYDRVQLGQAAFTPQQQLGLDVFMGKGLCINCHTGPVFSNATFPGVLPNPNPVEQMLMGAGQPAIYDTGFYNIGVRPTAEDLGVGGTDPFGRPLSLTRQFITSLVDGTPTVDGVVVDPCLFAVPFTGPGCTPTAQELAALRDAVDGAFKVPTLRNVALTGPYFHNGSRASLEQVVDFYDRGGDRRTVGQGDTTGFGINASNLSPDIVPLGLTAEEKQALVAFLGTLTDERVACEKAPFDHPALHVPHGIEGDQTATADLNGNGRIDEEYIDIPAVGASGLPGIRRPCLGSFESKLALD
ncbi:MAG: cytochrome-c peroxidase, partial [Pseudomonadota bacterium]